MKHAGPTALDALEPLLIRIRAVDGLKERARGTFYLKGRAALHFHEDPSGLYADVRLAGEDFERLKVASDAEQAILLDRLASELGQRG